MLLDDFKRKNQFITEHRNLFSKNQIDWWIRHRGSNGLSESGALLKAANQWYIHTANFSKWFAEHRA